MGDDGGKAGPGDAGAWFKMLFQVVRMDVDEPRKKIVAFQIPADAVAGVDGDDRPVGQAQAAVDDIAAGDDVRVGEAVSEDIPDRCRRWNPSKR
jgi:hypothetical protein